MKFGVIGLGRLGYSVATGLAEHDMEVLAVDSNESIVASIRDEVTQAICMRVTNEESLRSIGMDEIETVIVAMGENFAQSILVTALLKKRLGVPRVITRAINEIHKEILQLVGADQVILPEKEVGIRLADRLSSPFSDLTRLSKDFAISQIEAPKEFIGKNIASLELFSEYGITCIGKKEGKEIISVSPDYVIQEGDRLFFSGNKEKLEEITEL
jgi:trk system potassium uptake protein TrkA